MGFAGDELGGKGTERTSGLPRLAIRGPALTDRTPNSDECISDMSSPVQYSAACFVPFGSLISYQARLITVLVLPPMRKNADAPPPPPPPARRGVLQ